jgi:hypothetical protein
VVVVEVVVVVVEVVVVVSEVVVVVSVVELVVVVVLCVVVVVVVLVIVCGNIVDIVVVETTGGSGFTLQLLQMTAVSALLLLVLLTMIGTGGPATAVFVAVLPGGEGAALLWLRGNVPEGRSAPDKTLRCSWSGIPKAGAGALEVVVVLVM